MRKLIMATLAFLTLASVLAIARSTPRPLAGSDPVPICDPGGPCPPK